MLELSKEIVRRVELKGDRVRRVKVAFLVEASCFDPWFIGTDYCLLELRSDQRKVLTNIAVKQQHIENKTTSRLFDMSALGP